jgi:glucokinase
MTNNVVAVDVGGSTIKAGRYDRPGRVSARAVIPTPAGTSAILDAITSAALQVRDDDTTAVGVVAPGAIDADAGIARHSVHLGWRDVPLRAWVAERVGRPVVVAHDVTAAAIGESTLRSGDLLFLAVGTGVAVAYVRDGSVWRGASDQAGEIGHISVRPDGDPCPCGQRGCLEVYASGFGLPRRYVMAGGAYGRSAAQIASRVDHDQVAAAVWRDATDAIGQALATAVLLYDPPLIVVGGGLAGAGERLLEPVRKALAARLSWRGAPEVVCAILPGEAGLRGAAELAWRRVDRGADG